jgi:hypothetical protein
MKIMIKKLVLILIIALSAESCFGDGGAGGTTPEEKCDGATAAFVYGALKDFRVEKEGKPNPEFYFWFYYKFCVQEMNVDTGGLF